MMEWEHSSPSSYSPMGSNSGTNLRKRPNPIQNGQYTNHGHYSNHNFSNDINASDSDSKYSKSLKRRVVKNFDLFPKVETDLTVQTDQGARLSLLGTFLATVLVIAEWYAWRTANSATIEKVVVDTSLNQKMRVDLNISFPSLHCDDLHLDLLDVAGDLQLDVEDTMTKRRMHRSDMTYLSEKEIEVKTNKAHKKELEAREAIKKTLKEDYCGPCYGAAENIGDCCNFCNDVIDAYKKKSWHVEQVRVVAEQCVREHKTRAKSMSRGEGCQIAGYMTFNRLNGNFHIAMGEAVERNGHLIHTFIPEDMVNFNSSHIIHELRFGPVYDGGKSTGILGEMTALNGVQKIVKKSDGSTGTFQYYIKVVPTTYKGIDLVNSLVSKSEKNQITRGDDSIPKLETNRYFTTERFVPLMAEELTDDHFELGELVETTNAEGKDHDLEWDDDGTYDDDKIDDNTRDSPKPESSDSGADVAGVKVGGNTGTQHSHHHNHRNKQQILPGVFFIYQIYPFAVEVSRDSVPVIHLLIRIMATIGGVFTIMGWLDSFLYSREKKSLR